MATGNDRSEFDMGNINTQETTVAPECLLRTPALVGILGVLVGAAVGLMPITAAEPPWWMSSARAI